MQAVAAQLSGYALIVIVLELVLVLGAPSEAWLFSLNERN